MRTTLLSRIVGALRSPQRALSFLSRERLHRAALRARSRAVTAVAVAVSLAAGACGDGNGLTSPASTENVSRSYSVYALSGTSSALPAAYEFTTESLTRPQLLATGQINFDVAFDIGADGKVRVYPARAIIPTPPVAAPTLGVQASNTAYAALERAPDKNYLIDSVVVANIGQTFVYELRSSGCIYSEPLYAKLTIDSVIVAERRIVVRSLVNRNCGFRALTEGLPAN